MIKANVIIEDINFNDNMDFPMTPQVGHFLMVGTSQKEFVISKILWATDKFGQAKLIVYAKLDRNVL